jgi:hypothetical protein
MFTSTSVLTGTMGANGFLNSLETAVDSNLPNVTYTYNYATDPNIKGCLDTDTDGIPDVVDIDDDNDGVTDSDEGHFCLPPGVLYIGQTYFKSVTAQNLVLFGTGGALNDMTDGNIGKSVTGNFNWVNQAAPLVIDIALRFPVKADGYLLANDNGVVGDGVKTVNVKLYNEANQLIASQLFNPLANGATGAGNDLYDKYAFSETYDGIKRIVMEYTYSGITTGAATPNYQIREIGLYRDDAFCTQRDTDGDGTPDHVDLDSDGTSNGSSALWIKWFSYDSRIRRYTNCYYYVSF